MRICMPILASRVVCFVFSGTERALWEMVRTVVRILAAPNRHYRSDMFQLVSFSIVNCIQNTPPSTSPKMILVWDLGSCQGHLAGLLSREPENVFCHVTMWQPV